MLSLRSEDEDWSLHSEALTDFAMLVDLWKDRPDERNSLERDMWDTFSGSWSALAVDPPAFCLAGDLHSRKRGESSSCDPDQGSRAARR